MELELERDRNKLKWRDIRPSIVTHTWNSCSAFNPFNHTHTHTAANTHPEQWTAIYAAVPEEQLGVLAQGHLGRGIEGGDGAVHSLTHLQSLPSRTCV